MDTDFDANSIQMDYSGSTIKSTTNIHGRGGDYSVGVSGDAAE